MIRCIEGKSLLKACSLAVTFVALSLSGDSTDVITSCERSQLEPNPGLVGCKWAKSTLPINLIIQYITGTITDIESQTLLLA